MQLPPLLYRLVIKLFFSLLSVYLHIQEEGEDGIESDELLFSVGRPVHRKKSFSDL